MKALFLIYVFSFYASFIVQNKNSKHLTKTNSVFSTKWNPLQNPDSFQEKKKKITGKSVWATNG